MGYPIIYYFCSAHCAPCKPVERMLNEINISLFGNRLKIEKIDITIDTKKAREFNILSVPTIIIGNRRLNMISDKEELTDAILNGFLTSVSIGND